jgi:hypothetical protein
MAGGGYTVTSSSSVVPPSCITVTEPSQTIIIILSFIQYNQTTVFKLITTALRLVISFFKLIVRQLSVNN